MITLYDEQIEFRLLFTFTLSSTHISVVVNRSSSMFAWCARTNEVYSHMLRSMF